MVGLELGSRLMDLPVWTPRADSDQRRASAVAIAEAVLSARDLLTEQHLREVLSIAVWKYTECDGKYTTRFRSEAALFARAKDVHHEHVVTRRSLIDRIIAKPELVRRIFEDAVGCVVLRDEHRQLGVVEREHPSAVGWERYRLAGVRVWDLAERRLI